MNLRMQAVCLGAALCVFSLAGCGGGLKKFDVARTTGRVVCNGKPVPFATVFFEPVTVGASAVVGKQGMGTADADGNFTITTYDQNDGAVVGKHKVKVLGPMGDKARGFSCECVLSERVAAMEVDVGSDKENTFEIVLKAATPQEQAAARRQAAKEAEDD